VEKKVAGGQRVRVFVINKVWCRTERACALMEKARHLGKEEKEGNEEGIIERDSQQVNDGYERGLRVSSHGVDAFISAAETKDILAALLSAREGRGPQYKFLIEMHEGPQQQIIPR